jgi:hypothetical protein
MVATSCVEGDNDKDDGNSNEELIPAFKRYSKRQVRQPVDHFENLLEATFPNHTYPIRHKLKECTMMKNYLTMRTFAKGNSMGKAAAPLSEEKAVMSIYGRPNPHELRCRRKLTVQAINAVRIAVLEYLC